MLRHLKKRGVDTVSLMLNIEDVIIKSIISVAPAVAHASNVFQPNAQSCFGKWLKADGRLLFVSRCTIVNPWSSQPTNRRWYTDLPRTVFVYK